MELDHTERRGRLTYWVGYETETMDGNFQLSVDGRRVEARRLRGRNRFGLCDIEQVLDFDGIPKMTTVEIKPAETPMGGYRVIVNGSTFMRVNTKARATSIACQINYGIPLKDVK